VTKAMALTWGRHGNRAQERATCIQFERGAADDLPRIVTRDDGRGEMLAQAIHWKSTLGDQAKHVFGIDRPRWFNH